jgi:hypothetical protein
VSILSTGGRVLYPAATQRSDSLRVHLTARRKQEPPSVKMMRQVGGRDQGPIDRRSGNGASSARLTDTGPSKVHSLEILLVSVFYCPGGSVVACREHRPVEPDRGTK